MPLKNLLLDALTEDWKNGGFGLYIHWPFCQSKCPYCDFNSHVATHIDQARWIRAYLSEITRVSDLTPNRLLTSIYFGGGTPSLMDPHLVAQLIEAATKNWLPANDIEITLEANPSSVEASRFHAYREAGVNRVSMGIQALNNTDLKRLGRMHTAEDATTAFEIARSTFDRVNFDLIYARQHQTIKAWREELTSALSMGIDHLSLYQLTVEEGTVFGDRERRGLLGGLPDHDLSADMYDLTQDLCDAHGLPGYEISNHAVAGSESRHNLVYWRYGDYAGIGPGAHGRMTIGGRRYATEGYRQPNVWLKAIETKGDGTHLSDQVAPSDQATEFLLMGMRLVEGIDPDRYQRLSGVPLNPNVIRNLTELGLINASERSIRATGKGRPILNAILRELLGDY